MLHTKFHGNRPVGSREEDFLRVFSIYGCGRHLGHVTSIMSSIFIYLCLKDFIQNLVQNGIVVSEKIWFEFCIYTTLGQDQEMTLTFNTHIPS